MASVTWTSLTPHAPTAEFPGSYSDGSTGLTNLWRHVFDFDRGRGYHAIYSSSNTTGGVEVIDLNTFAVSALVSYNSMYAGTPYGTVPGASPDQTGEVSVGNGTNVYLAMPGPATTPSHIADRFTRVDPVTWKVTGEFYTGNTSTGSIYESRQGVVNKAGSSDIVAYQHKTTSELQIFNGASMSLLGTASAALRWPVAVRVPHIPGARGSGQCDFWVVNFNPGNTAPVGAIDLWKITVLPGVSINVTQTGTVDGLTLWPGVGFIFVQRVEYDPVHDGLILWVGGGDSSVSAQNAPAIIVSVTLAGAVVWTHAIARNGQTNLGSTHLTSNYLGVLQDGKTLVTLNTLNGSVAETFDIILPTGVAVANESYYAAYSSDAPAYTAALYGFNFGTFDWTLTFDLPRPPSNPRCGSTTQTSIRPTWDEVTGAASYTVRWRQAGGTTWTTISGITATSVTITGLADATSYEWQVATAISEFSAITTCTTLAAGVAITRVALLRPPKLHFIGIS